MHSHTSHQQQPDMSREIHEIPSKNMIWAEMVFVKPEHQGC